MMDDICKEQILRKRRNSNLAIAERNPFAAARHLATDVIIITSSGAAIEGRERMQAAFARAFTSTSQTLYERLADEILVGDDIAMERGRWTAKGVGVDVSGAYMARWEKRDDDWSATAEMFVPTPR